MFRIVITCLLLLVSAQAQARLHSEKYYQVKWCAVFHGQTEVVLSDKTRIDCVDANRAIEFDFANKWYNCLGQSLHYGRMVAKRPTCALIIENGTDNKYADRMEANINFYGLPIELIRVY